MNFSNESLHQGAMFNDDEIMQELRGLDPLTIVPDGLDVTSVLPSKDALEKFLDKGIFESVPGKPGGPGGGGLEAIVKLTGRPALLIQNDTYEKSRLRTLNKRLDKHKTKIETGIKSVGRVEILNHPDYNYVGTAWMIEEDVMITNRHVAETFASRRGDSFIINSNPLGRKYKSQVDFNQEYETAVPSFEVRILQVLHIEQKTGLAPDMALLKVEKSPKLPPPIPLFSRRLKLNEFPDVAVIGYPARDSRNNAVVMEDIFKGIYQVKRLSPGKVSGVHPHGHILMHDCTTLGGNSGSVVLDLESGSAIGLHFSGAFMENNFAVTSSTILNRMGNLGVQVTVPDMAQKRKFQEAAPKTEDMKTRIGYNPVFLGGDFEVPLPELKPSLQRQVVPVKSDEDDLLNYMHYSVKMHMERRMAIYTAVNIDGDLLYGIHRKGDYWYYDPRIDKDFQAGKELYKGTHLHKGHLVRRIDPAWGQTRDEAKEAAKDTFFYTNSTPQHRNFNPKSWLNLENYILENADDENMKVTVFTGPVFAKTDKMFRGFQIPEEYWKVVIVVDDTNQNLSASGYIVSQQDFMNDLEFIYGDFKTYHVSLKAIEKKTGLDFGLSSFDPLESIESAPVRVIRGPEDLMI